MPFDSGHHDLRQAWRMLRRAPIVAAVIIGSLGVGIGVNTVVFSWIQALVLKPLPGVRAASDFHLVEARADAGTRPGSSWTEYQDLARRLPALSDLLAFRAVPINVGDTSSTERATGLLVSGNYFSGLGIAPAAGRLIEPRDVARPGGEPVVVVSHGYWQTHLGGRASAIGQTIRANGLDFTVVGVTPENFQGTILGLQFELWLPATMAPQLFAGSRELENRTLRGYFVMGRLRPGLALRDAQSDADRAMRALAHDFPDSNRAIGADVLPFWRMSRGPQGLLIQALAVLQSVMLLLLLAVCGNAANLVLARASERQREMGLRLALGAGWWRVVRLLLVENLLLSTLGALLGVAIAIWGTQAMRAMPVLTMAMPIRFQTSVDAVGLLVAIALGVICALLFGALPAAQLARVDPRQVLASGPGMASRGRVRSVLMAVEVTLAMAVLVVAALFFEGFRKTQDTDPGFTREGVLLAQYDLTGRGVDVDGEREFARRLLAGLRALPDVEAAAIASSVPLDIHGLPERSFTLEGRARADGAPDRSLANVVTPGYFETMGIRLREGSDFAELGNTSLPPQAIVNEEFVRRYVGTGETVGRRVETRGGTYVIAGVVANSVYDAFGEPALPIVYLSYRDRPSDRGEIHVRTRPGGETLLAPSVRRAVRAVDEGLPVFNVRTMAEHVETNLVLRKIPARMFVVLGPLLLVLAAVGIYAVVSYTVAGRTNEIGVRMAMGASARRVTLQIVRESLRVIVAGAAIGWLLVYVFYVHLAPGSPLDPTAFGVVPLVLLLVGTIASWLPVRRAIHAEPMTALRRTT
jgi:predicted permease